MSKPKRTVAVIGAGIVGVSATYHLLQAGHDVLLIERDDVASGSTYGNAACINPSSIIPMALPGVLAKMPSWLLDPNGPLVLDWQYLPRMLPWLLRVVSAAKPVNVERQLIALRQLIGTSLSDTQALANATGLGSMVQSRGHLTAYSTLAGHAGDATAKAMRERHGVLIEEISQAALKEREPHLGPQFLRARFIGETGHLGDPGRFAKAVAAYCMASGARFIRAKVSGIATRDQRAYGVMTETGLMEADSVVIAAGSWSGSLARSIGDSVLLDTERGYHVEIPEAKAGPQIPTLWSEAKIYATPLDGRLRVAGTVELAGLNAPPNWRRTALLARQIKTMYPALAPLDLNRPEALERRWLGFRPSTPDSLPVIGRSPVIPNVIHAFGHGHIGVTAGAGTGRIVAELIAGISPRIDIKPFSIQRFA